MATKYWQKSKPISLQVQAEHLKQTFGANQINVERSELLWVGEIQPSGISQVYTVQIKYKLGQNPKVRVLEPALDDTQGTVPHVYSDGNLCLYRKEWNSSKSIAETIVPWTALWLLHYELWLATGKWHGGGIHPQISRRRKNKSKNY